MSTDPAGGYASPPEGFADSGESLAPDVSPEPDDAILNPPGIAAPLLDARAAIEDALRRQADLRVGPRNAEDVPDQLNIQGVGIGQASLSGSGRQPPGSPAIVVHLAYPRPISWVVEVLADEMGVAAARSDDIDISAVVTGTFEPLSHTDKWRPAPGGVSAGHHLLGGSGTLGCLATGARPPRNERLLMLSNNHVLARSNNASLGDCVVQPGQGDGGVCPRDQVAVLERMVPLSFGGGAVNYVDAATAWQSGPNLLHPSQLYMSTTGAAFYTVSNTPVAPAAGMLVAKSGRRTGLTFGYIEEIAVSSWVGPYQTAMGPAHAFFAGQLGIRGNPIFSDSGDSGSLVWCNNPQRNPVGLVFAGGGTGQRSLANDIRIVLSALDIVLVT